MESQIKGVKKGREQLLVSVLQRCPSYRQSNKESIKRQGPTLGVLFTEVTINRVECTSEENLFADQPVAILLVIAAQEMVMSDEQELVHHIHVLAYFHPCQVSKGNS